jgi:hypothetical protein
MELRSTLGGCSLTREREREEKGERRKGTEVIFVFCKQMSEPGVLSMPVCVIL